MLRLGVRRAAVQLPLLAAMLAVVSVGATLLGVCTLLLTTTQERALEVSASRAAPPEVDVTAYLAEIAGKDSVSVTEDTRELLTSSYAPFPATVAARATSAMRLLGPQTGGTRRWGYLSGVEALPDRARLTAGRWPRPSGTPGTSRTSGTAGTSGPLEAVVLEPTARALGLTPGSRVALGGELPPDRGGPVALTVVGVFRPLPGAGWDRDLLGAAGYDPAYTEGRYPQGAQAYGPFVVDLGDLLAGGSQIRRLEVTAHPDLRAPTSSALDDVAGALSQADRRLSRTLGDRVGIQRVVSDLPWTLALAHDQQGVTGATVLVVALLGTVLAAAALALAGGLAVTLRADESALLSALGAGRGQLAAVAAAEAGVLAVLASAVAVPASALAHAGITHLPTLARAGLAAPATVTVPQVAVVVGGAALLTAALVVPALRPRPAQAATRGRLGLLARSGADAALLALAVAGWWQLRTPPATGAGPATDVVRVLAPALCLFAGAVATLRLSAPLLRIADRAARRSRGLVLALAAFEAARRPQAVAAGLLLTLATAAATFGLAFGTTWERSQHDQGDLRVGTDLAVGLAAPPVPGEGRAVATATGGEVSPVTRRAVAVGQWLGDAGDPPRVVAVDTTRAGTLLRGRAPAGRSWAGIGAALAPDPGIAAMRLPARQAGRPTLTGTSTGPVTGVVPRLVVQDRRGLRTPCTGPVVPLDGRPHPVQLCGPEDDGLRIVAVALRFVTGTAAPAPGAAAGELPPDADRDDLAVTLRVPGTPAADGGGAGSGPAPSWSATPVGEARARVPATRAELTSTPAATSLRITATVGLAGPPEIVPEVVATAFAAPREIPVAVSQRLADALQARTGTTFTLTVGTTLVPVVVSGVVPSVPSAPGAAAVLLDIDALSRALITAGDLTPPVDAWWVGGPAGPDAAARARALRLGTVTTLADTTGELSGGPLRIGLPAALGVLVPASVLLLVAGTVMHVTSDVEERAIEVARLRGLGLARRDILGSLLAQHGGLLGLHLASGAAVGAGAAWVVGPLLVRSDLGAAPVPSPVVDWPWAAEAVLLGGLLVACTVAVTAVVTVQVRRADAAHLRVGP